MWDALPLELHLRIVHFIDEPLQIKVLVSQKIYRNYPP